MENLQDLIILIKNNFPKIREKTIIKIIFSIKSRLNLYGSGNIGFSRKEFKDFGCSESSLQKIIYLLRNNGIIIKTGIRKIKTKIYGEFRYCNIYGISKLFIKFFNDLKFFTKKIFEYINPIEFIRKYFKFKFKYGLYKFKINGNRYYINTKGKYKGVIYGESENKIINPLNLLT